MIVINLTETTSASSALAFTVGMNTNSAISYDLTANSISILVPGIYEIEGAITETSTAAGNYGIGIYINDADSGNSSIASATAASEIATIPIYDVIEVEPTTTATYVAVTFVPTGSPTITDGTISIKKIS